MLDVVELWCKAQVCLVGPRATKVLLFVVLQIVVDLLQRLPINTLILKPQEARDILCMVSFMSLETKKG